MLVNPKRHIVSLSGGKDSTAMLLRMLEENRPVDMILFCDTGLEFPQMYEHLDSVEKYIGRPITRLKAQNSFEYYFFEYTPPRKNPNLEKYRGMSWAGPHNRWCTGRLKTRVVDSYLRELKKEYSIIEYIGIAADETKRLKNKNYPLVDWGMTEKDCLSYCYERGFHWGGLYEIFNRVSCWCCPLQSLSELRKLYDNFPDLWRQLTEWDDATWKSFRKDYSVRQLTARFEFEKRWLAKGGRLGGREFYAALRQELLKCNAKNSVKCLAQNTECFKQEPVTDKNENFRENGMTGKGKAMSTYIHYTEEQKERARQTDIAELLRAQGETLKRSGKEYEWWDGGQKVTVRGNLWFHQYDRVGGDAIDFVRRFMGKTYQKAMDYLLGESSGILTVSPPVVKEQKPLVPPERNDNMRRVYTYLFKHRGIDREVLNHFAHAGLIYEDAKYHNAVFVGKDETGKIRHISKRGSGTESTYKGNEAGSEPEYSFHHIGKSSRLYVFEAPIDMLSYISLHKSGWQQHSYVALCSVADRALFYTLKQYPNLNEVHLCLDSDGPGQAAARRIAQKLFTNGYRYEIETPQSKDWNDDLCHPTEEPAETEEENTWGMCHC